MEKFRLTPDDVFAQHPCPMERYTGGKKTDSSNSGKGRKGPKKGPSPRLNEAGELRLVELDLSTGNRRIMRKEAQS